MQNRAEPRKPDPGDPATLYVGLGSNLGERRAHLRRALKQLARTFGGPIGLSRVYETAAWGVADQPDYLNMVAAYRSTLAPLAVLATLQRMETAAGRVRHRRWGSRTLDLDLLSYGHHRLATPTLTLPHPRIAERRFVLAPLAELAPALILPGQQYNIGELLTRCTDPLAVRPVAGVEESNT